jgi:hypothetical protein
MADRPILFSAPMIQALLAGRKTQTRRVLKLPTKTHSGGPIYERPDMGGWEATTHGGGGCFTIGKHRERVPAPEQAAIWHRTTGTCMAMPIQIGDRLWVREAHAFVGSGDPALYVTRADYPECVSPQYENVPPASDIRWRPSIHMPRANSRLTLAVTDVRVQRLQEISEEDALAEGIETDVWDQALAVRNYSKSDGWFCMWGGPDCYTDPSVYVPEDEIGRASYRTLWNSINGSGAWEANQWVAAYTFTVHRENIDRMTVQHMEAAHG